MDILIYCIKLIMYLLLVILSGNVLVNSLIPSMVSIQRRDKLQKVMKQLANALLLVVVLGIFAQIISWTQQLKPEINQLITMLLEESTGRVWIALLVLTLLFTLLNNKNYIASLILVLTMLLAESMNGHSTGDSVLVLFDFIHLAAISFWVGGVISLWWHWLESKDLALGFMRSYAKLLWISIAFVAISGVTMSLNIVTSWYYLLYTSWGITLLVKIAAVLVVLRLGYKAKNKLAAWNEQQEEKQLSKRSRPIAVELGVLFLVISIAALLGMLSPMPSGEKSLNYHQMGEELHYTVKMYPNAPGPNQLSLSLWTMEEEGEIEKVELSLQALDKQQAMPKVFQLNADKLDDNFEFPGFIETRYTHEKLVLPYPTKWQGSVKIQFNDGKERHFSFEFEN